MTKKEFKRKHAAHEFVCLGTTTYRRSEEAKLDLAIRTLNDEGWYSFTLVDFTTGTTTLTKEYDL